MFQTRTFGFSHPFFFFGTSHARAEHMRFSFLHVFWYNFSQFAVFSVILVFGGLDVGGFRPNSIGNEMKTLRHRRKRKGDFISQLIFLSSDSFAVFVSFILAYLTRFHYLPVLLPLKNESPDLFRYAAVFPVVLVIFLSVFRYKQIYVFDILRRRVDEIFVIVRSTLIAAVLLMALTFLYRDFTYSRIVFFLHCFY